MKTYSTHNSIFMMVFKRINTKKKRKRKKYIIYIINVDILYTYIIYIYNKKNKKRDTLIKMKKEGKRKGKRKANLYRLCRIFL